MALRSSVNNLLKTFRAIPVMAKLTMLARHHALMRARIRSLGGAPLFEEGFQDSVVDNTEEIRGRVVLSIKALNEIAKQMDKFYRRYLK